MASPARPPWHSLLAALPSRYLSACACKPIVRPPAQRPWTSSPLRRRVHFNPPRHQPGSSPAPARRPAPHALPARSEVLSWGFPKLPFHRHILCASCPRHQTRRSCSVRHSGAIPRAPSALAVSHDFDGLLRAQDCGSVAPRSRSWGSPGFRRPCTTSSLCHLDVAPAPSSLTWPKPCLRG